MTPRVPGLLLAKVEVQLMVGHVGVDAVGREGHRGGHEGGDA